MEGVASLIKPSGEFHFLESYTSFNVLCWGVKSVGVGVRSIKVARNRVGEKLIRIFLNVTKEF